MKRKNQHFTTDNEACCRNVQRMEKNTEINRIYINIESNKGKSLNTLFIQMLDGKVVAQGTNATLKLLGEVAANIIEANKHEILAKYVA